MKRVLTKDLVPGMVTAESVHTAMSANSAR